MNCLEIKEDRLVVRPYRDTVYEIIYPLENYVMYNICEDLTVDISSLNLIDAMKIAFHASSIHFAKYPFGNLKLLVRSLDVLKQIKRFEMRTVTLELKTEAKCLTDGGAVSLGSSGDRQEICGHGMSIC